MEPEAPEAPKPLSTSRLRANIYRILDEVLETGVPIEIERKGRRVRIEAVEPPDRLAGLPKRPGVIRGDPDDLVHVDWSHEWRP